MILVILLIAIMPLKRHPFWTGIGGEFTVVKYVGFLCVAYAVFYAVVRQRVPPYLSTWQSRWYLLFMLFVCSSFLSTSASFSGSVLTAASLLFLYIIVVSAIDTMKRLRWVLFTIVASLAWASLYVFRQWIWARGWETGIRAEAWVLGDSNNFAIIALPGITLAWYMRQQLQSKWQRSLCLTCILLLLGAVLLGGSRGGFLGLAVTMMYVAARSPKGARKLVVLGALLIAINVAYPYSPLRRLLNPSVNDEGSTEAHMESWQAGLAMIGAHPLTGIGIGNFRSQMKSYAPADYDGPPFMAHNAYIEVGAEMGLIALFVFCAVLVSTCIGLERLRRQKGIPPMIFAAAAGFQAALIGSAISIFSISGEFIQHVWLIVFVSACLPRLAAEYRANPPRPTTGTSMQEPMYGTVAFKSVAVTGCNRWERNAF